MNSPRIVVYTLSQHRAIVENERRWLAAVLMHKLSFPGLVEIIEHCRERVEYETARLRDAELSAMPADRDMSEEAS